MSGSPGARHDSDSPLRGGRSPSAPPSTDQSRAARYSLKLLQIGTIDPAKVSLPCGRAKTEPAVRTHQESTIPRCVCGLHTSADCPSRSPDKYFVQGVRLYLALAALLLIGAGSYLEFRRMRRAEYVSAESEKWLAERRHPGPRLLKRRKTIKKWAVRIPTAIVVLTWAFLDEAWSFASHVLHPHSGKLIGYQVSILLTWTIPSYTSSTYNGEYAHSIVVAERFRGLSRAWSSLSVGGRPSFSASTMNFRSTPAGDPLATKPASTILSAGTLPFGNGTITCREEAPPRWMTEPRYIHCSTPTGNFSGNFSGSNEDADEFYRVLMRVKQGD